VPPQLSFNAINVFALIGPIGKQRRDARVLADRMHHARAAYQSNSIPKAIWSGRDENGGRVTCNWPSYEPLESRRSLGQNLGRMSSYATRQSNDDRRGKQC
jgi:hypothetical protein